MSITITQFSGQQRSANLGADNTGVLETQETSGKRTRLLMVGWQGAPFNGRVHVVSSLMNPPFTDRFSFAGYDTRIRNRRGGSQPDLEFVRRSFAQITNMAGAVRESKAEAAVFFTGPGPTFWRDLLILRELRKTGIPVLIRLFGGALTEQILEMSAPLRRLAVSEMRHAKAFLVETNAMVADLTRLFPYTPAYRVTNFIDLGSLPKMKPNTQAKNAAFRIMYLGNMTASKGVETILGCVDNVCDLLSDKVPIEFHFIGGEIDKGYLDEFRTKCAALRHSEVVTIHGKMPRSQAHELAVTGDVFAFPTRWPGEGQPAALIEAMGMGLVPIATRWRGVAEIVRDGENGILLDSPGDSNVLGRAIIALAVNPRERLWMASAARAHIAVRYDVAPALEKFSRIVTRAIGSSSSTTNLDGKL